MKEQNLKRVKRIAVLLEEKRYKLAVIKMPFGRDFSIKVNARNNASEACRSISLGEEDIPKYLEEIILLTATNELERQIKALEDELETL